jgi:hypothetical protein
MIKTKQKLLNGKELKQEFFKVAHELPKEWMDLYLDNHCPNLRGSAVKNKYIKLKNIASGKSTPEPSEMNIIRKIIETDKAKKEKAKAKLQTA